MKKTIFTKNTLFGFIIGGILFGILGVGAASLIYSTDVTYDNTLSGLKATTVQGALDELYESAKNGGAKVSCNDSGECTVTCKTGNPIISDGSYACKTKVTCPNGQNFVSISSGYKCIITGGNQILKKNSVVTNGDGLYKDDVTEGRYFYRGGNVKNYITFNNEMWRIISIENDGTIKIVRNEQLSSKQEWDRSSNRSNSTSTYCTNASSYGCNAWAATRNLVNSPSEYIQYYPNGNTSDNTKYFGTVAQDSTMAIYLNGIYYDSLSTDAKSKVVKGIFNVSTPGYEADTESLEIDAKEEAGYQWKGYVALYTITELLRASTNSNCTSLKVGVSGAGNSPCNIDNWLWPTFNTDKREWTLSPVPISPRHYAWNVYNQGYVTSDVVYSSVGIRPVLHLSKDITLSGTGTSSDPYIIAS